MKGASTRSGVSAVLDARGVMEPWQEPRSGRGWFVLVLGIVVFAAFGGVVGYAYFKGLPGIGGEPPLIRAEPGPYRMAPGDRGGLAISNANSRIVSVLSDKPDEARVERVLPPETSPAFEASEPEPTVKMPEDADDQPGRLAATEPSATPPTTSDLGTVAPDGIPAADAIALPYPRSKPLPPAAEAEPQAGPAETRISALPPAPPAAEPPPPEPPPPEPAVPTAEASPPAVPRPPAAPATSAPRTPTPPAPEPQATPSTAPRQLVRVEPAAPPAAVATPPRTVGAGVFRLQLAAVRSEGGLTQAWADLRQRYPAALGGVTPQVERTDTTTGPLYRLQAGPFTSREAAANACGTIRASGGQCFIVGPIAQ